MTPPSSSTTSPYRTKLIEVALPLEAINAASSREKSIRHGHPSTLHLWWARRPLAACRAVLFASLVDDPSAWPELFPTAEAQEAERKRLFSIIEELVIWENSTNEAVLLRAQTEIARSIARSRGEPVPERGEDVQAYIAIHAPPIYDPFCGGGSIPLEAQRLGLEAHGSDLNPVAVLITKALIEIPPKFAGKPPVNPEAQKKKTLTQSWHGAMGLAEDVQYYGQWMRNEAERRIGHLYPKVRVTEDMVKDRPDLLPYVGQELTVIAWLWARTVKCPNPGCERIMPLIASFILSSKKGKEVFLKPIKTKNQINFEIDFKIPDNIKDVKRGMKRGKSGVFQCIFCNSITSRDYVAFEGKSKRISVMPIAIVVDTPDGRKYLPAKYVENIEVFSEEIPSGLDIAFAPNPRDLWCRNFGLFSPSDLFTSRQLKTLVCFSDLISEVCEKIIDDIRYIEEKEKNSNSRLNFEMEPNLYAQAIVTFLALGVSRSANTLSSLAIWSQSRDQSVNVFSRQALPMTWDFPEVNPFASAAGDFQTIVKSLVKCIMNTPVKKIGSVVQKDATSNFIEKKTIIATDPPYYNNISYADLSDFFYVWLRRSLKEIYPELFSTLVVPKSQEITASSYRFDNNEQKAKLFFEESLFQVFIKMKEKQDQNYPLTAYYAFKQSESEDYLGNGELNAVISTGWETILFGLIKAGFRIIGTWPLRTERPTGVKKTINALASSIVLVCRPRPDDAPTATRREFMAALKRDLPQAMRHLQQGNIAPVDLAQASIGPGMAVFTRYTKVLESDGSAMTVRMALGIINQVLDEVLAEQEGEFDADTRWAVSWFEQFGMSEGPFGEAETLSKAKNISVNGLVEAGVLAAKAGKVHLLSRDELPEDWDPATDTRLTVWETTQHLIRQLDKNGESGAADLLGRLGGDLGAKARDLAYRLYAVCERKKWAAEALAYNSLIISWPEIERLARAGSAGVDEKGQTKLI